MHSVATRPAEPKLVEHRAIVNCRRRRSRSCGIGAAWLPINPRVEGVRGGAGDETTAGTRHLAVGYGMLAGEPKTQKTRTAEDSAVPVASGKPWLGRLEVEHLIRSRRVPTSDSALLGHFPRGFGRARCPIRYRGSERARK